MRRALIASRMLLILWLSGCTDGGSSGPRISPVKFPESETSSIASKPHPATPAFPESGEDPVSPAPRDSRDRRRGRNNHNLQSGTLTAGSFDDNEQFDSFRQFISLAMQQYLPQVIVDDRIMIVVRNERGEPIGDAQVVIRTRGRQTQAGFDQTGTDKIVFDCVTGSDGRTSFLPSLAGAADGREFEVTIHPPRGVPASQILRSEQQSWQFTLQDAQHSLPSRLDLALAIDTTGSMGDELEYLKVEIDSIAAEVHERFPNVVQRYALILYRDEGDQYVTRTFDFTSSLEEFRDRLAAQVATGGGDYPEAVHAALEQAGQLSWRERDAARVLFLVGDAPPHDRFMRRALNAVTTLRNKNVRIFPVAASGADIKCEFVMRSAAFLTLGQYIFLTDHSGVGNAHAQPHVPTYEVEHLNKLMVRMIASELSGRHLRVGETIARQDLLDHWHARSSNQLLQGSISGSTRAYSDSSPGRWLLLAAAILGWLSIEVLWERCKPAKCMLLIMTTCSIAWALAHASG